MVIGMDDTEYNATVNNSIYSNGTFRQKCKINLAMKLYAHRQ